MPTIPVLVKSADSREVVQACIDPSQTAGELKAYIAEQQGLPPSSITQVSHKGEELPDSQQLSSVGITSSSRATITACGSQLFPNGWFESPYAKSFVKVLDITWPPLRQADYTISPAWLLALGLALLAVNSILSS